MPEKIYEVIKAVSQKVEVEVDNKKMPFGKLNAFRVKDPGIANAIRQKYGRKVTVTGISPISSMEKKLHPNRIVSPGMPWHKYDEFGRIIREESKEKLNAVQDRTSAADNQASNDQEDQAD